MENKRLSAGEMIENYFEANVIDVVFEEVAPAHQTIDSQMLSHQSKMGVQVQSVALPKNFKCGLKSEKETLDWLCKPFKTSFVLPEYYSLNIIQKESEKIGKIIKPQTEDILKLKTFTKEVYILTNYSKISIKKRSFLSRFIHEHRNLNKDRVRLFTLLKYYIG